MRLDKCQTINPPCSLTTYSHRPQSRQTTVQDTELNCYLPAARTGHCRLSSCILPVHPQTNGSPTTVQKANLLTDAWVQCTGRLKTHSSHQLLQLQAIKKEIQQHTECHLLPCQHQETT